MPVNKRLRKRLADPARARSVAVHRRVLDLEEQVRELKKRMRVAKDSLNEWCGHVTDMPVPRGAVYRAMDLLDLRRRR